jgi:hypothetical protein
VFAEDAQRAWIQKLENTLTQAGEALSAQHQALEVCR